MGVRMRYKVPFTFQGFARDLDMSYREYTLLRKHERDLPLAARLMAARDSRGFTIPEMADRLGVHRTSVWRWEHGFIRSINRDLLKKWAAICRVSDRWLFSGKEIGYTDLDMRAGRYAYRELRNDWDPSPRQ